MIIQWLYVFLFFLLSFQTRYTLEIFVVVYTFVQICLQVQEIYLQGLSAFLVNQVSDVFEIKMWNNIGVLFVGFLKLSRLRHRVTGIIFSCAAIHFHTVYNLHRRQRRDPFSR